MKQFDFPTEPFELEADNTKWLDDSLAFAEAEAEAGGSSTLEKVRWYQTILKVAGGFSDIIVNGNHNHPATRNALRRFQQFYKLQVTSYLNKVDSNSALTQVGLEWIYRTSLPNPKGKMEQTLRELIKQFQRDYELKPDGQVGFLTRQKMVQMLNLEIPSPLRRYHGVLGSAASTSSLAEDDSCWLISDGCCQRELDDKGVFHTSGIIYEDSREVVGTSRILDIPWRWTCLVLTEFPDPDGGKPIPMRASGCLVSAQHVLTAAHAVLDEIDGSAGKRRKKAATKIEVIPACNGLVSASTKVNLPTVPFGKDNKLVAPFGVHHASGNPLFRMPKGWQFSLDRRYDYAIIRLEKPIGFLKVPGAKSKRLGWWGSAAHGPGTSIQPTSKEYLNQKLINTSGYPACAPDLSLTRKQFGSSGDVTELYLGDLQGPGRDWFGHQADVRKGSSGGPIWTYIADSGARNLVGIQVSSQCGMKVGCVNHAIHLSPSIWEEITSWID